MKQQDINWPAVRALARVWRPIAEQLEMAAEADAGFDGGEWSGAFHDNLEMTEYNRVLNNVADRYNLDERDLEAMLKWAEYYEYGHLLAAVGKTQALRKMPCSK